MLLCGLHMVRNGIMRAFGSKLRRVLGATLHNSLLALLAGVGLVGNGDAAVAFSHYTGHHTSRVWASKSVVHTPGGGDGEKPSSLSEDPSTKG